MHVPLRTRRDRLQETHVLRLLDDTQDGDFVYLLLELCEQGDLLRKQGVLNEKMVRSMARQLMLGLQVVHKLGFIHRDIKPDNLLCTADGLLRIADFGWCCHKEDSPTCLAGTLLYMAPEVLSNVPQTVKADVWSAGMTLFQMIAGRTLLQTNLDPGMTKLSERDPVKSTLLRQQWLLREIDAVCPPSDKLRPNHVSPLAWDLVQKMLTKDPAERISVDEALSHPWLRELTEEPSEGKVATSPLPSRRKACEEVRSPSKDKVPTPSKPRSSKPNMAYTPPVSPEVTPERTPWPQNEFLVPDEKENSRDPEVSPEQKMRLQNLQMKVENKWASPKDHLSEKSACSQTSKLESPARAFNIKPGRKTIASQMPYWELKRSLGSAMENMPLRQHVPWNQLGEGHPNQAEQPVPTAKGLRRLSEVPEEGCKPQSEGCSSVKVPLGQLPRSPFAETGDLLTTSAPASRFNLRGVVGALPQSDKTGLEMLTPRTAERNPQASHGLPWPDAPVSEKCLWRKLSLCRRIEMYASVWRRSQKVIRFQSDQNIDPADLPGGNRARAELAITWSEVIERGRQRLKQAKQLGCPGVQGRAHVDAVGLTPLSKSRGIVFPERCKAFAFAMFQVSPGVAGAPGADPDDVCSEQHGRTERADTGSTQGQVQPESLAGRAAVARDAHVGPPVTSAPAGSRDAGIFYPDLATPASLPSGMLLSIRQLIVDSPAGRFLKIAASGTFGGVLQPSACNAAVLVGTRGLVMAQTKETKETALQRETRLTGNAELVSAIDSTLQAMLGQKANSVLARKVVGRWCQSANAAEFREKIRDYLGRLDEQVLLGFYMTISRRVDMMEAGPAQLTDQLDAPDLQEGGLLRQDNVAKIAFNTRSRASKFGLDRIAKQKRLERELKAGPMTAMSLDADPLADAPKPTMAQLEAKAPWCFGAVEGTRWLTRW
ncbi:IPL1 [Symbiodinium sp. CCMP2592]|nr:IPL1 [Symbiodinium sp. CCMP2592]